MRTIETKIYTFDELSEDAKEKAIEELYDINVNYDWWEYTYEDAKWVGLKLTGFDIGRGSYCEGELIEGMEKVIENILSNHGESCGTHKLATEYKETSDVLTKQMNEAYNDDSDEGYERYSELETEFEDLENEFLKELLNEYLTMLRNEYEYLTSEEAIIETIRTNEYEFTEDGKLF